MQWNWGGWVDKNTTISLSTLSSYQNMAGVNPLVQIKVNFSVGKRGQSYCWAPNLLTIVATGRILQGKQVQSEHCNCERILFVFMYMATTESDSLEICRIASSCFILVFKATSLFLFGFLCLLHSRWPWQKVCDSNIPIGCLLNSLCHAALWSLSKYAAMSYVKALKTF